MSDTFQTLGITNSLIKALACQNITAPTPIQARTFPAFKEGRDLVVESHTGSGKTLAFLLPLFEKIDLEWEATQAIILAPTHELVMQIQAQIKTLAKNSKMPITSLPIMGEVNIDKQMMKLLERPHIIVGTAGRILDLMMKRKINGFNIKTFILDEADNLLDQNQAPTIIKLHSRLNPEVQVCLFSASITKQTLRTAESLCKEPQILRMTKETTLNPAISHYYVSASQREKFEMLKKLLLATNSQRALIFVSQNTDTDTLIEKLAHHGFEVDTISGKRTKEERKTALTRFRIGKVKYLLSSDLSARGLDVPDITHVIHYDMPYSPQDYLHRSGRSARGTKEGTSICILTTKDLGAIRIFERDFGIKIAPITLVKGRAMDQNTKELLPVSETVTIASVATANSRNKYPKGFTGNGKKSAAKAQTKNMHQTTTTPKAKNPTPTDGEGSLADALALISQDKFGKNYE